MKREVKPFAVVYDLLAEYDPEEVQKALLVVPGKMGTVPVQDLAAACRDFLEGKISESWEEPRHNGFTAREWAEINKAIDDGVQARLKRNRETKGGYDLSDVRTFSALKQEIHKQRRMISDLLEYICKCDIPKPNAA